MSTLNHAVIEFLQQSNIFPLKAAPLKHSFVCTLGKLTLALFLLLAVFRNVSNICLDRWGWGWGGPARRLTQTISEHVYNHVSLQLFFFSPSNYSSPAGTSDVWQLTKTELSSDI